MLQLSFTGRNLELTTSLKETTQEKFERLGHRYPDIHSAHVIFLVENVTHTAEATVDFNGTEFHASAKSNDMYRAVDLLIDKLSNQLSKHKNKTKDHH